MRTITWTRKRLWLAALAGGATVTAALWASADTPPPYPSISPAKPAQTQATPIVPVVSDSKPDVKPAAGQIPSPPALPPSVVPKLETPIPAVPKIETPPSTVPAPAMPIVPVLKPAGIQTPVVTPPVKETKPVVATPTIPAVAPVSTPPVTTPDTAPAVPPVVTPVTATTEPKKSEVKVSTGSTVNISVGATPGVLDNTGKFDAMLLDAKTAYSKVHDYSCHFIKQERVKGKLTPETISELHVRTQPFAAYLKTVQPKDTAGFESVFVSGKFATNQVRVKTLGSNFITVPVDDSRAMSGRHPADQVGIYSLITTFEKMLSTERKLNNPMTVGINDFTYAGKTVTRYEIVCDKPHAHRYSHRTVLYVDKETKLPVRFESYDEPRGSLTGGDLLESYSFVNLKLNVGHSSAVFDR